MKGKTRRWQYNWSHWGHLAPISDFLICEKANTLYPHPVEFELFWVRFLPPATERLFLHFFGAFNSIYCAFLQVPNLSSTVTWPASELRPPPVHSFMGTWVKCWLPSNGATLHPCLQAAYILSTLDRILDQGFAACSLVNSDGVSLRES